MALSEYELALQAEISELKQDKAALAAELNDGGGSKVEVSSTTAVKSALLPHVPQYIKNIAELADAADSESVMLQANKLLIEWALTNKLDAAGTEADDEFKTLLTSIKAKVKKADAAKAANKTGGE